MTVASHLFSSYTPCLGTPKVHIAQGSIALVAGKGYVLLSDQLTLHSVLHVPELAYNLLSIS